MSSGANIHIDLTGNVFDAIKDLQDQFSQLNEKVGNIEKTVDSSFSSISKKIKGSGSVIATGFNQSLELVDKFADSLSFTSEIKTLETDIKRFTNLTGKELDTTVGKVYRLAEVFDANSEDITRAANSMTDQIGGTFESNLALIQKGYETGANLNKDMLQQLSEYGPQLKQSGLDGAQGLAIMSQAAKKGVYTDKALDAIKEGGLSIREMGKTQIDALAGIGLNANDLLGKSTFEAMQMISKAMQSADEHAKQMVLADIFKGAGEDAGLEFIEGLSSIDLNIDNLPTIKQSGEGIKSFFADVKSWIGQSVGDLSPYLSTLSQMGAGIGGLIPLLKLFNAETLKGIGLAIKNNAIMLKDLGLKALQATWTGVVTAAQWLWNVAMTANPIGLIIVGIGALVAGIAWLTDGFSGFGDFFVGFWEWLKGWFWELVDFFNTYLNPFGWLIDLIDHVFPGAKKAIFGFFGDLWTGVYDLFIQPFVDAWNWISEALGFGGETPEINGEVKHTITTEDGETKTFASEVAEKKQASQSPVANQYSGLPYGGGSSSNTKGVQSSGSKKESGFASAEKKEINTRIDSLVKNLNIHVPSVEMSKAKLQQLINEALVGAIRDFEVAI